MVHAMLNSFFISCKASSYLETNVANFMSPSKDCRFPSFVFRSIIRFICRNSRLKSSMLAFVVLCQRRKHYLSRNVSTAWHECSDSPEYSRVFARFEMIILDYFSLLSFMLIV